MTGTKVYSSQSTTQSNGSSPMDRQGAAYTDRSASNDRAGQRGRDRSMNGGGHRFPHIKDLVNDAQDIYQGYEADQPALRLLDLAERAARSIETDVSFRRPDKAYVQWLVASEIVANILPRHWSQHSRVDQLRDRAESQRRYNVLKQQVNSQYSMISQIYELIVDDNTQSGVTPRVVTAPQETMMENNKNLTPANKTPRPLSMPDSPRPDLSRGDELFLHTPGRPTSVAAQHFHSPQKKPVVKPKPQNLRVHTNQVISSSRPIARNGDDLAERFSQLRVQRINGSESHSSGAQQGSSTDLSSPSSDLTPSTSDTSAQSSSIRLREATNPSSPTKPSGPRSMPRNPINPAIPPKIPLTPQGNEELQPLPQPPKPAYDPAKITALPNTTPKPTLNRKPSIIGVDDRLSRSPKRNSAHERIANGMPLPPRSSSRQPPQTAISAEELHKQFQQNSVLVVDVRSREDFDTGHIFAKSIICTEPVGIRCGMSAEELEERLIYSPSAEQGMFGRRNEYDLVVYHDQSTQSDDFLSGSPYQTRANHLRALHDTLYEFNDYRPLKNRPLVLLGGLDAWIDFLGPQSLETTSTAAVAQANSIKRASRRAPRPNGRILVASANSSLEVRKRRLREQKPLNADEERRWLEKAQNEEVNPADFQVNQSNTEEDPAGEEPPSPFVHSYEDFLRRFPDAASVQPPSHPPPPPPTSQVHLPPRFEAVPSVPSRPAPALPRPSYSGVSDRDSTPFSPVSRQTSATQQPLYTSRAVSHYRKLPRTGLVNFGVTCYMNATIQCLVATIPLSQFFLGDQWRDLTVKNWKGSNGILPGIFANLVRSLWKDDNRPIRPSSLRSFCARLKDDWGIDRQQDAKEFFDFLVDCLHEDLNTHFNYNPLRPLTGEQERIRESWPIRKAAKTEWEIYSHRESSYISELFAGQHASRLRCTTCNSTSTTYEAFYSISVEIPAKGPKHGMYDIHSCLRSYCQEEKLSGDEVWKCPHCKKEREATKQIIITRAPQFLVVHFKRFEMRKGDAKKVHTPINFPLHGLDLGAYMVGGNSTSNNQSKEAMDIAMTPPYFYDCYAVQRHLGNTLSGGHYISLVRDAARGCWRKFDDDKQSEFDPAKLKGDKVLQNEQAYLVFYGRAAAR